MADLLKILQDPNYVKANPATKRAIFDKYAPSDPNYAKASPATQKAIRQKYGVEAAAAPAAPAAAPESYSERLIGNAASTTDLIIDSALGTAQWLSYPFRAAAGLVTGETAADIQASQERVQAALGSPVGRLTGTSEGAAYNQNALRAAMDYVGTHLDDGADAISKATGIPKPAVVNMMQSVMAAAPVKVPGAKTVGKVARGAVNKVQDIIDPKTKFYMDVAEGRGSELVAAARRPEAEIIPGVRPTFAQATADVGLPRVAAVGEQAEKIQPTAALARKDVQEAGRVGELSAIERTPQEREQAVRARARRADPLYAEAENAGNVVDVGPTVDYIDGLMNASPGNPQLLAELRRIRRGLTRVDHFPDGTQQTVLRNNAREISSTLDGIKTALAKEDNKFIKQELTNIKDDLIAAIPSMREAQTAFREGSRPINQMDVGRFLREKLETPLPEGAQRAGVFAQAVRDAPGTIKRALDGQPRYEKLTEVLSPRQQARVDAVLMDLSRDARVKEMAQMGREAAPSLREPAGKATLPPLLNRLATIANEIVRRLEGKVNEKMAMEIALEFLDANRAADALETAMRRSGGRGRTAVPKPPVNPVTRAARRLPVITAPNQMATEENRNRMAR